MAMLKFKVLYGQQDPKWSSKLLGFNTKYPYNLANYGCLITCQSMICTYYGITITPDQLNEKLKDIKGFVNGGGDYIWGSLPRLFKIQEQKFDTSKKKLTDQQLGEIKKHLDNGNPVMLQIDYIPATSGLDMHYVVAIDFQEEDFTIADPIDGTIKQLSNYSKDIRKLIYQYIPYIASVPDVPVEELETCEVKLKKMTILKDEWKERARTAEKLNETKDNEFQSLKKICEEVEQQRNDKETERSKLSDRVSTLENELKIALEGKIEAQNTISNMQSLERVYTFDEIKQILIKYVSDHRVEIVSFLKNKVQILIQRIKK